MKYLSNMSCFVVLNIIVLNLGSFLTTSGQEILESKSCKMTTCEAQGILRKIENVELSLNTKINKLMKYVEETCHKQYTTHNTEHMESSTLPQHTSAPTMLSKDFTSIPSTFSTTLPTTLSEYGQEETIHISLPSAEFHLADEFYFMFPGNNWQERYLQLMITSERAGKAEIYVPYLNSFEVFDLTNGTNYKNISMDIRVQAVTVEENKGIYVRTSVPVLLYAMHVQSDGVVPFVFPVLSKHALGTNYIANVFHGHNIGIVATADNTTIDILLHLDTNIVYNGRLYQNGETIILNMDRMHTFKLVIASITVGTTISANHPIAIFHGKENLGYKQLHSGVGWGTIFLIPGIKITSVVYDTFCITPAKHNNNTQLTIYTSNSIRQYNISESSCHSMSSLEFNIVKASKAVSVSIAYASIVLMIPPVTDFSFRFTCALPYFYRPYSPAYENSVYILSDTRSVDGIKVNGVLVDESDISRRGSISGFNFTLLSVNMGEEYSASISSEVNKIFVFVLGFSHDYLRSHPYVYQCNSL